MNRRAITVVMLLLLVAIQWPLWFGKGGWLRVRELDRELGQQNALNEDLRLRNQKLRSEVRSLKDGLDAIEERARYELGMIGESEIYVQVVSPVLSSSTDAQPVAPPAAGQSQSSMQGAGSARR